MEDDAYEVSEAMADYDNQVSLRSIAISAKRIADSLAAIEAHLVKKPADPKRDFIGMPSGD